MVPVYCICPNTGYQCMKFLVDSLYSLEDIFNVKYSLEDMARTKYIRPRWLQYTPILRLIGVLKAVSFLKVIKNSVLCGKGLNHNYQAPLFMNYMKRFYTLPHNSCLLFFSLPAFWVLLLYSRCGRYIPAHTQILLVNFHLFGTCGKQICKTVFKFIYYNQALYLIITV